MKLIVPILIGLGLLGPLPQAHALLIAECAQLEYIESEATVIVEAEVTDVQSRKEEPGHVFTYVTLAVKRYIRGEGETSLIIKQFGGTITENGETYTISDSDTPAFNVGDKGKLYLQQPDTPFYAGKYFTTVCATGMMDNNQ